MVWTRKGNTK